MKLKIIIHPEDDGGFWAEIPSIAGCASQGEQWKNYSITYTKLSRGVCR
jgi:hypothetical protein